MNLAESTATDTVQSSFFDKRDMVVDADAAEAKAPMRLLLAAHDEPVS